MKTGIRPGHRALALAAALMAVLPLQAHAHHTWLLPSATVLAGKEPWVTVDAAVSNELFSFEHVPLKVDQLSITGPDGKPRNAENASSGRLRNTFDVKLSGAGTYRIAVVADPLMASWKQGTENRRARGSLQEVSRQIPADAKDLQVARNFMRVETFVTAGAPTPLENTGKGIELVPITHPNDLVAGETARFRFTDDGKPAAGLLVNVVPSGARYRDVLNDMNLVTDAGGEVSVKWPSAGLYWMSATYPRADGQDAARPRGTLEAPTRRANYAVTLEVMKQ